MNPLTRLFIYIGCILAGCALLVFARMSLAVDVYPDLVSGTYVFHGTTDGPLQPDQTPTRSIGALRIDGSPGDQGVLDCQVVNPDDYEAVLTFTVALTDTTQNARVKLIAFPEDTCSGLGSEPSDNTAVMYLVPPRKPTLME